MAQYRKESSKPVSIDHGFLHDKKCELNDYIEQHVGKTSEANFEFINRIAYHEADTHDQGHPFGEES